MLRKSSKRSGNRNTRKNIKEAAMKERNKINDRNRSEKKK